MQQKYMEHVCIAFEEASTPICRECLHKEVEEWLKRRNSRLINRLKLKTKEFITFSNFTNNIQCVYCKKRTNACSFCYINYVAEWLRRKYPRLLAEFRLYFDFG